MRLEAFVALPLVHWYGARRRLARWNVQFEKETAMLLCEQEEAPRKRKKRVSRKETVPGANPKSRVKRTSARGLEAAVQQKPRFQSKRKPQRCSLCKQEGHNIQTCPQKYELMVADTLEATHGPESANCSSCRGEKVVHCPACFSRGRLPLDDSIPEEVQAERSAKQERKERRKEQVRAWLQQTRGISVDCDELIGGSATESVGSVLRRTKKCPQCGGAGWIECPKCGASS